VIADLLSVDIRFVNGQRIEASGGAPVVIALVIANR